MLNAIRLMAAVLMAVLMMGCEVARTTLNGEGGPIVQLGGAAGASPAASFSDGTDVVTGVPDPWSVVTDADGLVTTANGPVRSVGLSWNPETGSLQLSLASTSDLNIDGASLGVDEEGNPRMSLTGLGSGQTSLANARVQVYAQLVTAWTSLSADQKAVFIEQIQAGASIAEALAEVGITLATGGAAAVVP